MDRISKAILLTLTAFLLSCSSQEEDKTITMLGSEEEKGESTDTNETPQPKTEKTIEERNAEFAKQMEGWKARQQELNKNQAEKDKLAFATTAPMVHVDKKGLEFVKKTAAKGHPEFQYHLGMYYKYGLGVKQDTNKALYWFKKAADQGHLKAKRVYFFMLKR